MSQSVGPFCNLRQTVLGTGNGAAVTLDMVEYERERKWKPMLVGETKLGKLVNVGRNRGKENECKPMLKLLGGN